MDEEQGETDREEEEDGIDNKFFLLYLHPSPCPSHVFMSVYTTVEPVLCASC